MTLEFASNASKLHKKVGTLLFETVPFKGRTLRQEVPVAELFPNYPNRRDRFDWVIPKMKIVIECHGIQHYKFQTFGEDAEIALMRWREGKRRDEQKKQIVIESGWTYLEIPYSDDKELNGEYLVSKYLESYNAESLEEESTEPASWIAKRKDEQKALAKKARQENYKYLKGLKDKYKNERDS